MTENTKGADAPRASRRRSVTTKAKLPSNYTGKFTWVSKNASNLSTITKEELHDVHSHIQAQFVPWARRQKNKRIQSDVQKRKKTAARTASSQPVVTLLSSSSSGSFEPKYSQDNIRMAEGRNSASSEHDSTPVTHNTGYRRWNSSSTAWRGSSTHLKTIWSSPELLSDGSYSGPTPSSVIGNGSHDPFNASTICIDAGRHGLLLIWGERVMNGIWPSLRTQEARLAANKAWADDCRDGVWNEDYLHGLLAGALVVKARLIHSTDPSTAARLRIQSHIHQAKCLKRIRDELSQNSASIRQILVIWAMASVQLLDIDVSTCRLHLVGLKKMVNDLGGMSRLPALVQNKLLLWDLVSAGFLLEKPVFSVFDWGSRSLDELFASSTLESEIISQLKFSISLQNCLPFHPILTRRLQTRFTEHREATAVKAFADGFAVDSATAAILDGWLYPRQRFLEASNLFLFHDITNSQVSQESLTPSGHEPGRSLESCLCLAVSFLHRFIARHNLESTGCTPFFHLRDCLISFTQTASEKTQNSASVALLWMYFVGACAEELISRSAPAGQTIDWFTKRMLDQARDLGLLSFSSLREAFRLFLYDADTLDKFLLSILCKQEPEEHTVNIS